MQSLRTVPALVAVALFVVLLAAGIVSWSSDWTSRMARRDAITACRTEVAQRDPLGDVGDDLARGEDRFYFLPQEGFTLRREAAGVTVDGGSACRGGGDFADTRPFPFEASDAPGGSGDCSQAQQAYVRAYNAEMARRSPRSVDRYCRKQDVL